MFIKISPGFILPSLSWVDASFAIPQGKKQPLGRIDPFPEFNSLMIN